MALPLEALARVLATVSGLSFLAFAVRGRSRWTGPTARSLVALLATLGVSALLFALTVPAMALYQVVWLYTLVAVPVVFALFSFEYYGIDYFSTAPRIAALVTPAALVGIAGTVVSLDPTSPGAGGRRMMALMRGLMPDAGTEMGMGMETAAGLRAPLAALLGVQLGSLPEWVADLALAIRELGVFYVSGLTLVAGAMLLASVYRYRHLDTGLGVSLAFVGLWPWAAYAFMPTIAEAYSWQVSLATNSGGFVVSLAAVVLAVEHYDLFGSQPAAGNVGAATVLDSMNDSVFVLDRAGHILRLNAAAERTFGVSAEGVVGRPLSDVLGVDVGAAREGIVELETVAGRRQFEAERSTVPGHAGDDRGAAVVLRDVTQRRTREQRLQVLSRVLRHNLRNDLTVIRGQAEIIGDGGTVDPEAGAETIRQKSDELLSITERAREAQQVVSFDEETAPEAEIGAVVSAVQDTVAERYPDAELTAAAPEETRAAVDAETLEIVLQNLVENACKHNDADPPIVTIAVDRTDEGDARIVVRDNGPGIPEMERRVVESGVEDPLEHGSGLGLWTAKWGVTQMGGTMSFADNAPRGTVVQVVVPAPDATVVPSPDTAD